MQYVQRKLQRSVTEIRRSWSGRPRTSARAVPGPRGSSDRQSSDTFDGDSPTDSQAAANGGWPSEDGSPSNATATSAADASAAVDPWASPATTSEPAPAPSAPTPPPAGR